MKERPILFNGAMVRAIIDGRKTQTRRVIKKQPGDDGNLWPNGNDYEALHITSPAAVRRCPYGARCDRLWVRETAYITPPHWCKRDEATHFDSDNAPRVVGYVATMTDESPAREYGIKKTPSIHMPRWASRITLEITYVTAQRLQDISEDEAAAEGIPRHSGPYILDFAKLWDQINAKRGCSWDSNPWVWVVEFERVEGTC